MKLRAGPGKGQAAALDAPERLRQRRDGIGGIARIETYEIGRSAHRDAIIREPHQPRRGTCDHIEASGEVPWPRRAAPLREHDDDRELHVSFR